MQDAVAVALEGRADATLGLVARPAGRLVRADGEGRERTLLLLADACGKGVGNSPGNVRHKATLDDDGDGPSVDGPGPARHIRGPFRQEEHDHVGDLAGLGETAEGPARRD